MKRWLPLILSRLGVAAVVLTLVAFVMIGPLFMLVDRALIRHAYRQIETGKVYEVPFYLKEVRVAHHPPTREIPNSSDRIYKSRLNFGPYGSKFVVSFRGDVVHGTFLLD
jgi:hypothetical protein